MTIIAKAANSSRLTDLQDLIARIVGIGRCRVDAAVPVQLFDFRQARERIFGVTLLSAVLVCSGSDFAAGATAATVAQDFCVGVRIGCLQRPTLPIVTLLSKLPCRIGTGRRPSARAARRPGGGH